MSDGVCKMLLCGVVLGADGAFGRLRGCLGLLRQSLKIGLRGSAALGHRIADRSMQFLRGSSNVVERLFDIRIYFSHDVFSNWGMRCRHVPWLCCQFQRGQ
jgi:hypothetical protein